MGRWGLSDENITREDLAKAVRDALQAERADAKPLGLQAWLTSTHKLVTLCVLFGTLIWNASSFVTQARSNASSKPVVVEVPESIKAELQSCRAQAKYLLQVLRAKP